MVQRLFIGLGLLLLAGPSSAGKVLDRIAAVVNHEVILLSEVDERARSALASISPELPLDKQVEQKDKIRHQALEQLIEEKLLDQKVREHHIEVGDKEIERQIEWLRQRNNMDEKQFAEALALEGQTLAGLKRQMRRQLQQQKLIDLQLRENPELRARVQVAEKDIQAYYQSHYTTSSAKEKIRARHILFLVPPGSPPEKDAAVRQKAEQVLKRLREGEDFQKLAKQFSDDPSGAVGGDLGWFRRGDMMEEFEKAAFALAKGQISGLVHTRLGYHIIKLIDRASEGPPPLAKVRDEIRSRLAREKFREALSIWLSILKKESFLDIKL